MAERLSLLEQVRRYLRLKHYIIRTEVAYVQWIKRFILFHRKRHPAEMGSDEIRQFLSHLATDRTVAAATQNQALCALLFLYREALGIELPYVEGIERAKQPARIPVVLTRECGRFCPVLSGRRIPADGGAALRSGLRLMECVRLLHEEELLAGYGRVYLPYALERKYQNAAAEWVWQWVFPSAKLSRDPCSGEVRRHHASEDML